LKPPLSDIILATISVEKTYADRSLRSLLRCRAAPTASLSSDPAFFLEPLSFEVPRGGSLALIGENGAGKTTLLRLLAGLARPTRGQVLCRGRRAALLELGAGFLDELDGIQNARLMLSLTGCTGSELDGAVIEAGQFSGLAEFLREPVRTYSSGMRLRLAYAVAVVQEPEVLLADEVLAVGDEAFQRKCSEHVARFRSRGGTLILASHNLYQVEKLCDRALWLRRGKVAALGPVRDVTASYRAHVDASPGGGGSPAGEPRAILRVTREESTDAGGFCVRIERNDVAEPMQLELRGADGVVVAVTAVPRGVGSLTIPAALLLPAVYRACLRGVSSGRLYAEQQFQRMGHGRELGSVRLSHRWG
jgi:lipopolysaccharide transport system ATP-binding protein